MDVESCMSLSKRASLSNVIWAKLKGWSWWPAQTISETTGSSRGLPELKGKGTKGATCVIFFGGGQVARISEKQTLSWEQGIRKNFHMKATKRKGFRTSLTEAVSYLEQGAQPQRWWCTVEPHRPTSKNIRKRGRNARHRENVAPCPTTTNHQSREAEKNTPPPSQRVDTAPPQTSHSQPQQCNDGCQKLNNIQKPVRKRSPGDCHEHSGEEDVMDILYGSIPEVEVPNVCLGNGRWCESMSASDVARSTPPSRFNDLDKEGSTPQEDVQDEEKNIVHGGNLTIEDIIDIARIMRARSCAVKLAGTCKEILGTCVSVGCTVEHEDPRDIQSKIDEGEIEIPEE